MNLYETLPAFVACCESNSSRGILRGSGVQGFQVQDEDEREHKAERQVQDENKREHKADGEEDEIRMKKMREKESS